MPVMNFSPEDIPQKLKDGTIKIAIFGLGRIGLPTALQFAASDITVYGVDVQSSIIETINNGNIHIDEPGIDELFQKIKQKNRFHVTSNYEEVMRNVDVCIICVPTPVTEDKIPDYSIIIDLCNSALKYLKKDDLIIVESTISPGTIENLIIPLIEKNTELTAGKEFGIASCPERANPGSILSNFRNIPRVIGGYTLKSTQITAAIYRNVTEADLILVSNAKTANAVKLTENIFRDVNIALINELAILYEKLGLDIIEIIEAASSKYNFQPHYPGAGVGGPCLPANPYYLIQEAVKVGFVPHLIRMAREINDRMPQHIVELTLEALNKAGKSVKKAKITIFGIAYKPQVHDFQISPAIPIIQELRNLGAEISIYDPLLQPADTVKLDFLNKTRYAKSITDAAENSDCVIFVTAHNEFKDLKLKNLAQIAASPLILVDGRNIFKINDIPAGTIYMGVGRKLPI